MLRAEVWKKSMTSASPQLGAFDTSTTTWAPARASASPWPVMMSTPVAGDAASGSWPARAQLGDEFRPDQAGSADYDDLHLGFLSAPFRMGYPQRPAEPAALASVEVPRGPGPGSTGDSHGGDPPQPGATVVPTATPRRGNPHVNQPARNRAGARRLGRCH